MSAPALVLGLDSGGSKTLAAVVNESGDLVLLEAAGGTGALDRPDWDAELSGLLERSLRPGLVAAALGLSAFGEVEAVTAAQRELVAGILPCPALLHTPALLRNDVEVAFDGAFAGGPGILLLAGTGSMVWAGGTDGSQIRVGGWGDLFGDEGSAYWLGREALSLTAQLLDGRRHDEGFASAILAATGAKDASGAALLDWLHGLAHRRSGVAALARTVIVQAEAGNALADQLVDRTADQLAAHVDAARERLPGGDSLPWSVAGGLFNSVTLSARVAARVGSPCVPARLPPLGGAILDAAKTAGWSIDDAWIDRLQAALLEALPSSTPAAG